MIRIELQDSARTMVMRIEGGFVGQFAENARKTHHSRWNAAEAYRGLVGGRFVRLTGEEVLAWFGRLGGLFIAKNPHSQTCLRKPALANGKESVPPHS